MKTLAGYDAFASFDDNGNTLRGKLSSSVAQTANDIYDLENHLVTRTTANQTIQIAYDGDGNRVRKTVGSVNTYYIVDDQNPTGYAQVLQELSGSGKALRVCVYGHNLINQRTRLYEGDPWQTRFFGYDGHGSVRFLMWGDGTVSDTYTYDAFGVQIAQTGNTLNNYRYSGEQWDSDLGLYYNRARYLNPNTGRFWSMDTYEGTQSDPLSLHKYLYAHGDPINLADPSGYDANFTLVGQTTTQGMDLNSRAMGVGTVATFAHSVRASLLFRLGAYAVLGTTVAGNVAIVADALQKAKSEPLNYRPVTSVDEEEDLEGDLTVHRMGGKSNMNLKPAEKNLSPPGFSVLVGGTPDQAAAQMRAAFPPTRYPGLHQLSKTVGSARISRIRAIGFDVVGDPTSNFPNNHSRLIHQSRTSPPFENPSLLRLLSSVFADTSTP